MLIGWFGQCQERNGHDLMKYNYVVSCLEGPYEIMTHVSVRLRDSQIQSKAVSLPKPSQ
jgi:hypothetical protein